MSDERRARGALVIVAGLEVGLGPSGMIAELEDAVAAAGFAACTVRAFADGLKAEALARAEREALDAALALEEQAGPGAFVLGLGIGGVVAMSLAMKGLVGGVGLWDTDAEEYRDLRYVERDTGPGFRLDEGDFMPGDAAFLDSLLQTSVGLSGRLCPVPVFSLSSVANAEAADSVRRWVRPGGPPAFILQVNNERGLSGPVGERSRNESIHETIRWLESHADAGKTLHRREDGTLRDPAEPSGDRRGRVFISYRHGHGTPRALRIHRHLDAAGIRNFFDEEDLHVGSVTGLIRRSFKHDCAGGVLVVTDDLADSPFVRDHELPELLRRARANGFVVGIDNTIPLPDKPGQIDADGPDRLLELEKGTLADVTQFDLATEEGMRKFLRGHLDARLAPLRGETVYLDVESYDGLNQDVTRGPLPESIRHRAADLRVRVDSANLSSLVLAFPLISTSLDSIKPRRIMVTGGARPAVGFALGALLVGTRLKCEVLVQDAHGTWGATDLHDPHRHVAKAPQELVPTVLDDAAGEVAIFLKLLDRDNDAFAKYLATMRTPLAGAAVIEVPGASLQPIPGRSEPYDQGEGARVAAEVARAMRDYADDHNARTIHLFAATTFPLSVLIGRHLNDFGVLVYDRSLRENPPGEELYHPVLRLSVADSRVVEVFGHGGEASTNAALPAPAHEAIEELRNYTPHNPLTYWPEGGEPVVLPQLGSARCRESIRANGSFDAQGDYPRAVISYGEVEDLPGPEPGVVYVVSQLVVRAHPERTDLAFPAGLVRDDEGTIIGFSVLARFEA